MPWWGVNLGLVHEEYMTQPIELSLQSRLYFTLALEPQNRTLYLVNIDCNGWGKGRRDKKRG